VVTKYGFGSITSIHHPAFVPPTQPSHLNTSSEVRTFLLPNSHFEVSLTWGGRVNFQLHMIKEEEILWIPSSQYFYNSTSDSYSLDQRENFMDEVDEIEEKKEEDSDGVLNMIRTRKNFLSTSGIDQSFQLPSGCHLSVGVFGDGIPLLVRRSDEGSTLSIRLLWGGIIHIPLSSSSTLDSIVPFHQIRICCK